MFVIHVSRYQSQFTVIYNSNTQIVVLLENVITHCGIYQDIQEAALTRLMSNGSYLPTLRKPNELCGGPVFNGVQRFWRARGGIGIDPPSSDDQGRGNRQPDRYGRQ
jgi:hypothetical protein